MLLASQNTQRTTLGFDSSSIVLGRHGGLDTWNLPFVSECIKTIVSIRKDMGFLFMNTKPFIEHPRVRFLPGTADEKKN